jgi:3-oxoacid CoA-transferase subunit A/glutaconate CoA-transferase subunit A
MDSNLFGHDSRRTCIPYFYVDAVVEVPYGSHPCNMPTCYYFDEEHMAEYLLLTRTTEGTKKYFDKYVYSVKTSTNISNLLEALKS